MNPELPKVRPTVEVVPGAPRVPERAPQTSPETERQYEQSAEQLPTVAEAQAQVMQSLPVVPPSVPPSVPDDSTATSSTTPLIASDDDLIEKEWVDKLKKIIALTKDDPYERNRVITQFQADYLKKRYNKTLGQPEE